jgi:transcription elongation factor SPT5
VKDAVRGLRNIYTSKAPKLVPIKEMVDAITVNRKAKAMIGLAYD